MRRSAKRSDWRLWRTEGRTLTIDMIQTYKIIANVDNNEWFRMTAENGERVT